MTRYKTVFLDWNRTLSNSKFWGQLENPKHPRSDLLQRIEHSLFKNLRDLLCPWMRGECTSEEICEMIAKDTGLSYRTIFADFIVGCREMKLSSPRLLSVVQKIRNKGVHCVVATDNMDSFPRWTVPALNLTDFFDGLLVSSELKCLKADLEEGRSKFFAEYLESQDLGFNDSVSLDDDPDDQGIFSSLGIDYIQVFSPDDLLKKLEKISQSV